MMIVAVQPEAFDFDDAWDAPRIPRLSGAADVGTFVQALKKQGAVDGVISAEALQIYQALVPRHGTFMLDLLISKTRAEIGGMVHA